MDHDFGAQWSGKVLTNYREIFLSYLNLDESQTRILLDVKSTMPWPLISISFDGIATLSTDKKAIVASGAAPLVSAVIFPPFTMAAATATTSPKQEIMSIQDQKSATVVQPKLENSTMPPLDTKCKQCPVHCQLILGTPPSTDNQSPSSADMKHSVVAAVVETVTDTVVDAKPWLTEDEWKEKYVIALSLFDLGHYKQAEAFLWKLASNYSLSNNETVIVYHDLAWNQAKIGTNASDPTKIHEAIQTLEVAFIYKVKSDLQRLFATKAEFLMELHEWKHALDSLSLMRDSPVVGDDEKSRLVAPLEHEITSIKMKCWLALANEEEKKGNHRHTLAFLLPALHCAKEEDLSNVSELQERAFWAARALEHPDMDPHESYLWLCVMMPKCQVAWKDYTERGMTLEVLSKKLKSDRSAFPGLTYIDVEILEHLLPNLQSRMVKYIMKNGRHPLAAIIALQSDTASGSGKESSGTDQFIPPLIESDWISDATENQASAASTCVEASSK